MEDRRKRRFNQTRVNRAIRVPVVFLIDQDGVSVGVCDTSKALSIAYENGLDLVEVAPMADPPVCRIVNYGKYKYDEKKKVSQSRKENRNASQLKEIKMRPNIDSHDYDFKMRKAQSFLEVGHRVRFVLRFRGREITKRELYEELITRIIEQLVDSARVENKPTMEGRQCVMTMVPIRRS